MVLTYKTGLAYSVWKALGLSFKIQVEGATGDGLPHSGEDRCGDAHLYLSAQKRKLGRSLDFLASQCSGTPVKMESD